MPRVLVVVSASRSPQPQRAPRKDYMLLADRLGAKLLDRSAVQQSRTARVIARLIGPAVAQAWLAFRQRHAYEVLVTDGEHLGIPLALLLKLARSTTPHVTIGHRLSAAKKRPFFRWLKVHSHMSKIAVHARRQYELALRLGIPAERLAFVPYQVDTTFWQPQAVREEPLISSAGLECRDYPTLFQAVDGLPARVIVGASSYWSHRANTAKAFEPPANVEVGAFNYEALRELYARSAVVVVPLDDTDFQAGVTTILEAMAMGKPVVVSHSQGQTDVVTDRRSFTRGLLPRYRPTSMLLSVADELGALEPNGFYVVPGDPTGLRRALVYLLEHPEERARLGQSGRRTVERLMTVEHYAARFVSLIEQVACTEGRRSASVTAELPAALAS
jgi:glycosyltransferase involved in cell wall biosynthesis